MTGPAPVQHRYSIRRVPRGQQSPAIGEGLNPNRLDAVGDSFDELPLAQAQAKDIQELETNGVVIIVCDLGTWTRVA